jgi:hypothetical protein
MPTAKDRPRGRPPSQDRKMSNRYSINYSDAENDTILAAAKVEGDPYTGRWIGKAALAYAEAVLKEKKTGR